MFGSRTTRTGIDLGGSAIKLVHGHVRDDAAVITHLGWEPVEMADGTDRVEAAGAALRRLLRRLKLGRRDLGRIAVGVEGRTAHQREVELPALAEADLRRALRFEAGRHLDLEGLDDPVLDFQVLGPADRDPATGAERVRVLLAAMPRAERDDALAILRLAGLEPQVVDLQPLAALNAVLAQAGPQPTEATALLDLGAGHAAIHVSGRGGALLSRTLAAGGPPDGEQGAASWRADVVEQLAQTLTFYRGRHRRRVERIMVAGRGALIPGVLDVLQGGLEERIVAFADLPGLAAEAAGRQETAGQESLFAAAYGLCRWWDGNQYGLNFYRESASRNAASRRRALQLGLGVALLGTAVLLVGLLMVSVRQLQDRAAQVRAATERLQARAQGVSATSETDLELAWSFLKVRQERVDWAPQLAALAETIGPELVLVGLKGQGPGTRQAVALEMTGRFSRGEAQLDAVTGFVENLRRDERIASALPVCRLGEVREGAQSGFTITCQRATELTP